MSKRNQKKRSKKTGYAKRLRAEQKKRNEAQAILDQIDARKRKPLAPATLRPGAQTAEDVKSEKLKISEAFIEGRAANESISTHSQLSKQVQPEGQ